MSASYLERRCALFLVKKVKSHILAGLIPHLQHCLRLSGWVWSNDFSEFEDSIYTFFVPNHALMWSARKIQLWVWVLQKFGHSQILSFIKQFHVCGFDQRRKKIVTFELVWSKKNTSLNLRKKLYVFSCEIQNFETFRMLKVASYMYLAN